MTDTYDRPPLLPVIIAIIGIVLGVCASMFVFTHTMFEEPGNVGDVVPCDSFHIVIDKETRLTESGYKYYIYVDNASNKYEVSDWGEEGLNKHFFDKIPMNRTVKLKHGFGGGQGVGFNTLGYVVVENVSYLPNPNWKTSNVCVVAP